jgi:aminoglycoside phosphotransferase (APT) family kinase protein
MPGPAVTVPPRSDPALEALPLVLDGPRMLPIVAPAAGLDARDHRWTCAADVLKHWPGTRCTVRYTVTDAQTSAARAVVVGKAYARPGRARRAYARMRALSDGPFPPAGPLSVAAPLALHEDMGLVLRSFVDAPDLRSFLPSNGDSAGFAAAARWLAKLHATPPPFRLDAKPLEHEVAKQHDWCAIFESRLEGEQRTLVTPLMDALRSIASRVRVGPLTMVHRDFYPEQVLWDGAQTWVLDLDDLALGLPALDVGNFVAQIRNLALRRTDSADSFEAEEQTFLQAYEEAGRPDVATDLPFFIAHSLLGLAATEASRLRDGWEQRTPALLDLALRATA